MIIHSLTTSSTHPGPCRQWNFHTKCTLSISLSVDDIHFAHDDEFQCVRISQEPNYPIFKVVERERKIASEHDVCTFHCLHGVGWVFWLFLFSEIQVQSAPSKFLSGYMNKLFPSVSFYFYSITILVSHIVAVTETCLPNMMMSPVMTMTWI